MTQNHIYTICSVAIASNSIIGWWESCFEPLMYKKNIQAYNALCCLISSRSASLAKTLARCEKSERDIKNKDMDKTYVWDYVIAIFASWSKRRCARKLELLGSIEFPKIGKNEVKSGATGACIRFMQFIAFLFAVVSIFVLVFSKQFLSLYEEWLIVLFFPQILAFIIVAIVYSTKLFPWRILRPLLYADFTLVFIYEYFLLRAYLGTSGADQLSQKIDIKISKQFNNQHE